MDIVKFAYHVEDLYKKGFTEKFAACILGAIFYLSLFLSYEDLVIVNCQVAIWLILLSIAYKCTSGIRKRARRKTKQAILEQEYIFDKNKFIEIINSGTINTDINVKENSTEQQSKRTYISSPAPQGELLTQDAANLLGVRPTVLTLLRKYKREAEEYNISTDDSYGPSPIQKRKNGRVTYLESEILKHSKLFQEGTLRYITEAQHYDRIKNHNIK